MAQSGVTVDDSVVDVFNQLKLKKEFQCITFKFSDDLQKIVVDQTFKTSTFQDFVGGLPEKDGRYAIFDFHFAVGDQQREQLVFINWCPETAAPKMKMLYASSKGVLKKKLLGVNHEIQANDMSDLAYDDILEKVKAKQHV